MDVLTRTSRKELFQLRAQTLLELKILWAGFDIRDEASWTRFMLAAETLIRQNHLAAGSLASRYYQQLRAKHVPGPLEVRPAAPPPHELIQASLQATGLAGTYRALKAGRTLTQAHAAGFTNVSRAVTRHVMNGHRDTIVAAQAEDEAAAGFARITTGTCAYCASLAAEGTRTGAFHAHDGCACVAEPDFSETSRRIVDATDLSGNPESSKLWGSRNYGDWAKALTKEQRQIVKDWTEAPSAVETNGLLRAGSELSADQATFVSQLDDIIDAAGPLSEDMMGYRGFGGVVPESLKVGAVIEDAGFTAVSQQRLVALNASYAKGVPGGKSVLARIFVPEGTRGAYVSQVRGLKFKESEFLMARGQKFRVRSITETKYGIEIELEVLP